METVERERERIKREKEGKRGECLFSPFFISKNYIEEVEPCLSVR
jgi:hypothetical protein